jgi:3-oxoacyl-(acyl-carrier-protein) synthase
MSKFMQYAMAASAEALKDSGWLPKSDLEQEMTVSRASNTMYQLV